MFVVFSRRFETVAGIITKFCSELFLNNISIPPTQSVNLLTNFIKRLFNYIILRSKYSLKRASSYA